MFTAVPGHPTAQVPGRPGEEFVNFTHFRSSPSGNHWMFRAIVTGPDTADEVIAVGSGTTGMIVAKEGEPSPIPGRNYGPLDGQFGINDVGHYVFGTRLDGSAADNEIIFKFDGTAIGKAVQMGDPAPGLTDDPPGASGNELFGQFLDSAHILNDGRVAFQATNIQNAAITRNTALYHGNTVILQNGTMVGTETVHTFFLNTFRSSALGEHYIVMPDIDLTNALRQAVVVDERMLLRQGDLLPTFASPITNFFVTEMTADGTWYTFGRNADFSSFVLRGDSTRSARTGFEVLARSGDPIFPGSMERYFVPTAANQVSFGAVAADPNIGFLILGATDTSDPQPNVVIVLNNQTVVVREQDPVDLDGNGLDDDGALITAFQANAVTFSNGGLLFGARIGIRDLRGPGLIPAVLATGSRLCTKHLDCNDGSPCTLDTCRPNGQCDNDPRDDRCGDGFDCTEDFCEPESPDADESGCVHDPRHERCDDGDACTEDNCDPPGNSGDGSGCDHEEEPIKDDGIECTKARCDPETGNVTHEPVNVNCPNDPAPCLSYVCDPHEGCVVRRFEDRCRDSFACTKDSCDENGNCVNTPDDGQCADPFSCTEDHCEPGNANADANGCTHAPRNEQCNDGDPCTVDRCEPSDANRDPEGCIHRPRLVEDDFACTVDGCNPETGEPYHTPDHTFCEERDSCTNNTCNPDNPEADGTGCVRVAQKSQRPCGDGDVNQDGAVDEDDIEPTTDCLQQSGPGTVVGGPCAAADRDGDLDVDISDAAFTLNFLFLCDPSRCKTLMGRVCDEDCPPGHKCVVIDERGDDGAIFGGGGTGSRRGHCQCESDLDCSVVGRCERCVDGLCKVRCDPAQCEGPCDGAGNCPSLCRPDEICDAGQCRRQCVLDRDCNVNACEECRNRACVSRCAENERCVQFPGRPGRCSRRCSPDNPCPECHVCIAGGCLPCEHIGRICVNGQCFRPCRDNLDCPECQRCDNGICVDDCPKGQICYPPVGCREMCRSDQDCARCQWCARTSAGDVCLACDRRAFCQTCNPAGRCVSNCKVLECEYCDGMGNCVSRCQPDERCINGTCIRR
jgi:hypothetical protein